jgi:NTP pyrophosphatase (non-canonical NTP hydrolase)
MTDTLADYIRDAAANLKAGIDRLKVAQANSRDMNFVIPNEVHRAMHALSYAAKAAETPTFQRRVQDWMIATFSMEVCRDTIERNHRFLEEALELVQALGCTASEAHQLVDYVYGRGQGDVNQEVGGVMVTLAALCLANDLDMHQGGETELARVWTKIDQIREKQASKPKHSPLPQAADAKAEPLRDELPEFEDARVQIVYKMLCDDDLNIPPNPEEHWEGWISRNIVAALALAPPSVDRAAVIEAAVKVALEQRCEHGTPWDRACVTIAEKIRCLADAKGDGKTR